MPWGGRRLEEFLGKALPTQGPYGEAWEISDHALHRSVVNVGPARGQTLRHLMETDRQALVGNAFRAEVFPWLVKLLDAQDWLSVQVHPDDETARLLRSGEGGKTEAWFILDAAPESKVYAGLLPGTDEAGLRHALAADRVTECLHQFRPRPGDILFLPAGTVHAVGGGVLMAEIQQTSDATFRLFDWNRRDAKGESRPLHVEEALASIDWHRGPVVPMKIPGYPEIQGESIPPGEVVQHLVDCPFFVLDYRRQESPFTLGEGRMQVVIGLHGKGIIETAEGPLKLTVGDSLLLPAAMEPHLVKPLGPLGLLVASLP